MANEHTEPVYACRACVLEHERCVARWYSLSAEVRSGTTMHGAEAHHPVVLQEAPDGRT